MFAVFNSNGVKFIYQKTPEARGFLIVSSHF